MSKKLTDQKILIFDVYATLIDWETGLLLALEPLLKQFPSCIRWSKADALTAFASVERDLEAQNPGMLYSDLLERIHEVLEERLKAHENRNDTKLSGESGSSAS